MSTDAQAEPIRKHLVEASIEFWHATGSTDDGKSPNCCSPITQRKATTSLLNDNARGAASPD
jgi:hypothetical protein